MSWHKGLNSLSEIPQGHYEGYFWTSDEDKPHVCSEISAEQYEINGKPAHPFIREAMLFDKETGYSISVRHLPGEYMIHQYSTFEFPAEAKAEEVYYLAQGRLGKSKLKFIELWLPEPNENCENMNVLTKKALVFAGFEEK